KIKMFFWDSNNIIVEGASDDSSSLLHDYKHKVYLPVDPESGRVSGSRRIGAVFVTKNIDRLSPIQKEILCEGKKISKIQLSFYKYNENKKSEVEYYQVILEDAIMILDSACVVRNTIADSIFYGFHETLGFVAHKFTWRDLESGIEYTEEQPEMNVFTQNNENDNGRFQLCNYPNPFNDRTNILFSVPSILQQEKINISVFDARGRLVKELFNTISEQNHVNVYWDGTNRFNNVVSSGVYFYRISAGHDAQTGKLTFIK
ncbi:MAG: type VI secretion system tube protein Hcp, partial [Methanosarcinaceae archaeon]